MRKSHEQFVKEVDEIHSGEITVLGFYTKANERIRFRHSCGYEWKTKPSDLLHGYSCPYCRQSKGEKFIREFLTSINASFVEQYTPGDCKYKHSLHFDFAIMNDDEPQLIIEFDGMQHYKPTGFKGAKERFKVVKERDNVKNKYCDEKNISLLRIPYWKNHDEIEQEILSRIAGDK